MKKIFLLAGAVIICSLASQAQFKVGIVTGANVSNQHRNDVNGGKLISNEAFKGFHAGVVADWQIAKNIYLQPQLLYTRKGAKYTAALGTDARLTLNYVEMPVNILYKVNIPFGKIVAGAGPVIGYSFSGKLQNNGQVKKLYSTDMKNWNRLDISANAMAGLEFNNGFFANVNYQYGFKDINKSAGTSVKNRSVGLSVGYLVNIGSK